jgi:hypothetical protein
MLWLFWVTMLVVIPGPAYLAACFRPQAVFKLSLMSIGLGLICFGFLFLETAIGIGLVNPYVLVGIGILSTFLGMGTCVGFGIWKIADASKKGRS